MAPRSMPLMSRIWFTQHHNRCRQHWSIVSYSAMTIATDVALLVHTTLQLMPPTPHFWFTRRHCRCCWGCAFGSRNATTNAPNAAFLVHTAGLVRLWVDGFDDNWVIGITNKSSIHVLFLDNYKCVVTCQQYIHCLGYVNWRHHIIGWRYILCYELR